MAQARWPPAHLLVGVGGNPSPAPGEAPEGSPGNGWWDCWSRVRARLSGRFGAAIAIGLIIFVLSVVTVIICFTCSCCYLYKMCRRPHPVVTTTTATTVVHAPYSQPAGVPPSYPGHPYQGYQPMAPPGMPAAPYPTPYAPPYLAQPMGPPAYHGTLAGGVASPYPAPQPPYDPAYMEPPKAAL